jgi:hypothetical protein
MPSKSINIYQETKQYQTLKKLKSAPKPNITGETPYEVPPSTNASPICVQTGEPLPDDWHTLELGYDYALLG